MSTSSVGSSLEIIIFMFPFLGRIVPDAVYVPPRGLLSHLTLVIPLLLVWESGICVGKAAELRGGFSE